MSSSSSSSSFSLLLLLATSAWSTHQVKSLSLPLVFVTSWVCLGSGVFDINEKLKVYRYVKLYIVACARVKTKFFCLPSSCQRQKYRCIWHAISKKLAAIRLLIQNGGSISKYLRHKTQNVTFATQLYFVLKRDRHTEWATNSCQFCTGTMRYPTIFQALLLVF